MKILGLFLLAMFAFINAAAAETNVSQPDNESIQQMMIKRQYQGLNQAQIFEKQLLANRQKGRTKRSKRISGSSSFKSNVQAKSTAAESGNTRNSGGKKLNSSSLPSLSSGMFIK